jgi:prepilin-type processing-associated H-X9-DG protein
MAAGAYAADNRGVFPHFWEWLHAESISNDITTGVLYPYVKNRAAYLCPTDQRTLGSVPDTPSKSVALARTYSYAMNCALCHQNDASTFLTPSGTLLWTEANLDRGNQSGVIGPVVGPSAWIPTKPISTRHNGRGHLLFADLHVQRVTTTSAARLERSKRFWLPTDDDPFNLYLILPDP